MEENKKFNPNFPESQPTMKKKEQKVDYLQPNINTNKKP